MDPAGGDLGKGLPGQDAAGVDCDRDARAEQAAVAEIAEAAVRPQQYALPLSMAHVWSPPAEMEEITGVAASASCGAAATEHSPAISAISTAGVTRRASCTRHGVLVAAGMTAVLFPAGVTTRILLLSVMNNYAE
jgi:hypothetical protein